MRQYPIFLLITLSLLVLTGCNSKVKSTQPPGLSTSIPVGNLALPLSVGKAERRTLAVRRWMRPIMGRKTSLAELQRTTDLIQPIVRSAVNSAQMQPDFIKLAHTLHLPLDTLKSRWIDWQTADILLESGGDQNSVSSVGASGVAQWMPETARSVGLHVDIKRSVSLIRHIQSLEKRQNGASGTSAGTMPTQQYDATLAQLYSKLQTADNRFDPNLAIWAQTRYLLRLSSRYPLPQWLFQAYHGGQWGVEHLLHLFSSPHSHLSARQIILNGDNGGVLTFEHLYFNTSPLLHASAFRYLYSRGDDDRHYWWKILAAGDALTLYSQNRDGIERAATQDNPGDLVQDGKGSRWVINPGSAMPSIWYPQWKQYILGDAHQLQEAVRQQKLLTVSPQDLGWKFAKQQQLIAPSYPAARPQTVGLLRLIISLYTREGGKGMPIIGELTSPLATAWTDHVVPDFPNTGLEAGILWPANTRDKEIMLYVLDMLADRRLLALFTEQHEGYPHWTVCPAPEYSAALTGLASSKAAIPVWHR